MALYQNRFGIATFMSRCIMTGSEESDFRNEYFGEMRNRWQILPTNIADHDYFGIVCIGNYQFC